MTTGMLVAIVLTLAFWVVWVIARPRATRPIHPTLIRFREAVDLNTRRANAVRDALQELEMLPGADQLTAIGAAVAFLLDSNAAVGDAYRAWLAAGAPER